MLNKVQLQGRLTANPELRKTPNEISVTAFTLAVDRAYRSGSAKQTDFINVVAWRGTAEFVSKFFTKGKMMIVDGKLQVRNYTAQDGTKRYVTEVVADEVHFAGDKQETAETAFTANTSTANTSTNNEFASFEELVGDDSELPF